MTRYLNLYWLFLIQRFKTLMEYRANFIIGRLLHDRRGRLRALLRSGW